MTGPGVRADPSTRYPGTHLFNLIGMGDPACHLSSVCLSCGRFLEASGADDCPHCGHHFGAGDAAGTSAEPTSGQDDRHGSAR